MTFARPGATGRAGVRTGPSPPQGRGQASQRRRWPRLEDGAIVTIVALSFQERGPARASRPVFIMRQTLDLPGSPNRTRVVVAMSGGVDSSVVAGAAQRREGYDVVGVTLQLYDHGEATHRKGACCAGQDIHDARRVAATLGIPHYVLDYEERFRTR